MKKQLAFMAACALTLASSQPASAKKPKLSLEEECAKKAEDGKPAKGVCAVLKTLSCIESENLPCAIGGYAQDFVKLHNGVDTNTVINPQFWGGAFALTDISLDINHAEQVGKNMLSIRYVETVEIMPSLFNIPVPDSTVIQHEHALVTFNEDGQMTLWDQYGDNAEQQAVDDAIAQILPYLLGGG